MMGFQLTPRDIARMQGLHPDLVRVIKRAAATSPLQFCVLEGLRTLETQRKYVARGASKTMKSRHLTGHAIDIAPMLDGPDADSLPEIRWDWPLYHKLAPVVKAAAAAEGVLIEWGGDWRSFKDGPHWQLPWASYP